MVVAKTSRKGKKAWRRNIDTTQELEALATATEEARQGTAVASLQDQQLFYVDTDGAAPSAPTRARRVAKPPKTTTKAQAILHAAHRALPVHTGHKRRPKGPAASSTKSHPHAGGTGEVVPADPLQAPADPLQAPADPLQAPADPLEAHIAAGCSAQVEVKASDPWAPSTPSQGWDAVQPATARPAASQRKRTRGANVPVSVAAIEVDAPGCSFNPEEEAHQDALAIAVATEVAKDVQRVLSTPAAPPKRVDYVPETDELALLQVDAVSDDDDDGDDDDGGDMLRVTAKRAAEAARKTQRDLNKAKRRRAQEAIEEKKKALKKQRRDLDALASLQQELDAAEQARLARRARLEANRRDRALQQPPKLGRVPFVPEPVHVALTEEVNGSLRTVKAAPMVLRERYKSLQRRGVIEPRVPAAPKVGRRVGYVHGSRADAALEREAEIATMRTQNKRARRAAKKTAPR